MTTDFARPAYARRSRGVRGLGSVSVVAEFHVSERVPGERARIVVQGRSSEDGSTATMVIIHEENGTWSIHGLGGAGVRLSRTDMIAVAEAILARAQQRAIS
jgi:hypothetical protein